MSFKEFLFGKKEPPKGKIAKAAQWSNRNPYRQKTVDVPSLIDWLNKALEQDIPEEVRAFCFNLYNDCDGLWALELIGAARFDPEDEDWACDEVTDFDTREHPFRWEENAGYEDIQAEISGIVQRYPDEGDDKCVDKLTGREAVGVGFADGNIELVYCARGCGD